MITSFKRRLDVLEREKKIAERNTQKEVLPYLNTLTPKEVNALAEWMFRDMPWKQDRPDEYYASLLYRAMNGETMPQGYDWLNGLCDGELPSGSNGQ